MAKDMVGRFGIERLVEAISAAKFNGLARPPHDLWGLERGSAVHGSYVVDFARPELS